MPFTLTEDVQFYGLKMSLGNILMIILFRTNNKVVFFLKQKKSLYQGKYLTDHTFMTSTLKGDGGGGVSHMSVDSFIFKQKIYCLFLRMEGVGGGGGHKIGHYFVAVVNV